METYFSYLQRLAEQTEHLRVAVVDNDLDEMLACLEARQQLIGQIDALPDEQRTLPEEQHALAARLLEQIAAFDQESVQLVESNLAATRQELENQRQVSSTLSAYRRTTVRTNPAARFMDTNR